MRAQFGSFTADFEAFELFENGKAVHIEPQAFNLLKLLIENGDRVVAKDELIEAVWEGRAVSDAAISTALKSARRALGENGATYIKTVHGRGLRLVGEIAVAARTAPRAEETLPASLTGPSVVVLPLLNVSDDPAQQHIADGITVDLIGLLALHRWLRVVGASSAFAIGAQDLDLQSVGRKLDVRYAVEGSVRRAGDRLRISAALCRVSDGRQVWGSRFNRDLEGVFELQEEVAQTIAAAVEPELAAAEASLASAKAAHSLTAWEHYHRGVSDLFSFKAERLGSAVMHLEAALAIDPAFAAAHARLAYVNIQRFWVESLDERPAKMHSAEHHARAAISLDGREALGYLALGAAMMLQERLQDALGYFEDALTHHPAHPQPHLMSGEALCFLGRYDEAIGEFDEAERLGPYDPHLFSGLGYRGLAYAILGNEEASVASAMDAVRQPHVNRWGFIARAAVMGQLNRKEDAKQAVNDLLNLWPDFDVSTASDVFDFLEKSEFKAIVLEGLRRAGVPEGDRTNSLAGGRQ